MITDDYLSSGCTRAWGWRWDPTLGDIARDFGDFGQVGSHFVAIPQVTPEKRSYRGENALKSEFYGFGGGREGITCILPPNPPTGPGCPPRVNFPGWGGVKI